MGLGIAGQGQELQRGAERVSESQLAGHRGVIDDGEKLPLASTPRCCGVDNLSYRLIAVSDSGKNRISGNRRLGGVKRGAAEVTFETAEILGAGDDFLTRIATLVETQAIDAVQMQRLRQKEIALGRGNARDSRPDVEEIPGRHCDRC